MISYYCKFNTCRAYDVSFWFRFSNRRQRLGGSVINTYRRHTRHTWYIIGFPHKRKTRLLTNLRLRGWAASSPESFVFLKVSNYFRLYIFSVGIFAGFRNNKTTAVECREPNGPLVVSTQVLLLVIADSISCEAAVL